MSGALIQLVVNGIQNKEHPVKYALTPSQIKGQPIKIVKCIEHQMWFFWMD